MESIARHSDEAQRNLEFWHRKPMLRKSYRRFHELIAASLLTGRAGRIVEIGSGVPDIREVIPGCLRTDPFPSLWLDQTENAYALSFPDGGVSALILFDVFHHLRYPGTALAEFYRALSPGGRVIIFEPFISLLGRLIYGLHHEPIAFREPLTPDAPPGWLPTDSDYYAAISSSTRIFCHGETDVARRAGWRVVNIQRLSAISYVLTGGYSKPQLYPDMAYPLLRGIERICDWFPALFATRMLIVLEKTEGAGVVES